MERTSYKNQPYKPIQGLIGLAATITAVIGVTVFLDGCTSNSADVERLTAEVKQVKEENKRLQAKMSELESAPVTAPTERDVPSKSADVAATAYNAPASGFADVSGMFGEKEVNDLARLNVLNTKSGKFEPTKPITRAEFVEWLITTNNALRPDKFVRPAEPGAKATFPDVPTSHPGFKWIQGMSDAGWSIGYEDKTFKPDKILSREEMFAIKAPFDEEDSGSTGPEFHLKYKWADWKKITPRFLEPMGGEARWYANWPRIFGNTKNCDPQKSVSRAEAAVCVWQLGGPEYKRITASQRQEASK